MQPTQNYAFAAEAFRRRAGQQPSSAGLPGGAPVANTVTAGNPLAGLGPTGGSGAPMPPQSPTQEPIKQLKQSRPGEAEVIVKALVDRLKKNPVEGGMPATA